MIIGELTYSFIIYCTEGFGIGGRVKNPGGNHGGGGGSPFPVGCDLLIATPNKNTDPDAHAFGGTGYGAGGGGRGLENSELGSISSLHQAGGGSSGAIKIINLTLEENDQITISIGAGEAGKTGTVNSKQYTSGSGANGAVYLEWMH